MKPIVTLLFMWMTFVTVHAQENTQSCSFEESQKEYYKKNPKALNAALKFEEKVKSEARLKNMNIEMAGEKYIVPVVFHVYGTDWNNGAGVPQTPVTDERVKEALKKINEDFKGFNDAVDNRFANIEGSMDIEFRLAQVDPDGNTTSGIIYHEYREGFGLNGTNDAEIARYAWDNYKYFNVHLQIILKSGSRSNSGIAWFPNESMSDEGTARVVYNGRYIIYDPPASSLTHEFGHFFGLDHTFAGGCVSGADNGDKVGDTPPTLSGAASTGPDTCSTDAQNCFGEYINYQNHMDYNPCESMFTAGQVTRMESFMQHPARITLWQDQNLIDTGINTDLGPRVLFTYQDRNDSDFYKFMSLIESFENDGTILNKRKIKAVDGATFASIGDLQEGVHYTTENVPAGLNVKINVIDATTAEISLDGNATTHEAVNSRKIKVTLLNPAVTGGVSSIHSATGTYSLDFLDTYEDYYEQLSPFMTIGYSVENTIQHPSSNFYSVGIGGSITATLSNFDGNTINVDNFSNDFDVLCSNNSRNVKFVPEGGSIGATGNWVTKTLVATPTPVLSSETYTAWRGQTGYIGIRTKAINGEYLYSWLKTTVSLDGTLASVDNIGVNPDIGNAVTASISRPYINYSTDRFLESDADDKTVGNTIDVTLNGNVSFAATGALTAGTHYTIEGVPTGVTFQVTATSTTTAKLALTGVLSQTGNSDYNGWDTYRRDIKLKFLNAAFTNNNVAAIEFTEFEPKLEFMGDSFEQVLTNKSLNINDSEPQSGSFYMIANFQNVSGQIMNYQLQEYKEQAGQDHPGIKFISWRKDAVANDNYELTPINAGELIGPSSNWKNGRQYNSGSGQHLIDGPNYTAWRGQTKYIGVRFRRSGRFHYAWIEFRVSSAGQIFEFLKFGVNGTPEAGIYAGTLDSAPIEGQYCAANGTGGPEAISKVTFSDINNSSERNSSGYEDFTNITGNVSRGTNYPLVVDILGYNGGSADEIYAWFDWNQNGDFTDAGEYVLLNKTSGLVGQATIAIPQDALSGETRMRIRVAYDATSNVPCGTTRYGEVEDYTINVGGISTPNNPPTASITSPTNNASFSAGNAVSINANATDSDGTITKVEFFNGSSLLGEDLTAPYSYNWTNLEAGNYTITVKATDDDGASTISGAVNIAVTTSPPVDVDYCAASGNSGPEAITNVRLFGGINNSSGRNPSGYEDFTDKVSNLNSGTNYYLYVTIEGYQGGVNDEIYAWFDWNKDGDFLDANEYLQLDKTSSTAGRALVSVPQNIASGTTRMRIRVAYYANSNVPCGARTYGEVEDYTLNISSSVASRESSTDAMPFVENNDSLYSIKVFPNPIEGNEVNINFNSSEKGEVFIKVFNIEGVKVFELKGNKGSEVVKSFSIPKNLSPGLYLMKVKLGINDVGNVIKIIIK